MNVDAIIIGAGHHGLILGTYMARAGLKVLLTERRLMHGGGLSTVEATIPGFYHNTHSINHFHISHTPWYRDLELDETVPYITPQYEFGQPHKDGSALVFGRDLEETLANISRFSEKDAATFREWNLKAERMTQDIFLPERYAEPLSAEDRRAILTRSALGSEFLDVCMRQPLEVVEELFENEHVQLLFLFKVSLFGTWLTDTLNKTSPMGSVIRAFDLTTGYQLCKGGSFNLARGLMERFVQAGGIYWNQCETDRIVIENGRATGVEFKDGRSARASKFVASTVDVHQTFETFVGRDQLGAAMTEKLDGFKYTGWTLFGVHLALEEMPQFSASAFDPNLQLTQKWSIGAETMEDLNSAFQDVTDNKVPDIVQFGSGPLSVLDPSLAPEGKHNTYAWHVMPLDPDLGGQDYEDWKEEFADRIIERWGEYAPNMTPSNVLGRSIYTAREYVQELPNMRHGDIFMGALSADQVMDRHFGYRTPIEGLYMAGSAAHPGGAISGGAGYITAGIIADDLGIKPWWRRENLRDQLKAAA